MHNMLSAPEEKYKKHIEACVSKWKEISSRFLLTLSRLFEVDESQVDDSVIRMLFAHDVGKLTSKWQEAIQNGKKTPPHATLGAAYLLEWNQGTSVNNDLANAAVFAVLIHHTDKGIAGSDNLECPDAQTVQRGLIKGVGGKIIDWHEAAQSELIDLGNSLSLNAGILSLHQVTLESLVELSDSMREWSKCPRLLDQHKHRLLASGLHHILKICDWRASAERRVENDEQEVRHSVLEVLLHGGILP